MSFLLAIVGRPNVGKSRLFNRLSTTTKAIVHDFAGVTRDRQYARGEWFEKNFTVIDTGGFMPETDEPMLQLMRAQARLAIEEADAIIFMMDGRAGLVMADREIAAMLRETTKPIFHVVNKLDSPVAAPEDLAEFYEIGAELYALSAEHGHGFDRLMDDVAELIPRQEWDEESPFARVAVVGKPNAGKSSFINRLLGEERLLTSEVAGTTRDSVDTMVRGEEKEYLFIDTAGLRRKKRIAEQLEHYAVVQAIRSIDRADVALFMVDATEGISAQDKKIAGVTANRGRACVIVINKWDLIANKDNHTTATWTRAIRDEMPFMHWAPIIFTSALSGQRVHRTLQLVDQAFEQYTRRVTTSKVNDFLEAAQRRHRPPVVANRKLKFYFGSQVATRPPAFVFMANYPDRVPASYKRYMENQLREEFGFEGTPLRIMAKERRRNG